MAVHSVRIWQMDKDILHSLVQDWLNEHDDEKIIGMYSITENGKTIGVTIHYMMQWDINKSKEKRNHKSSS